MSVDLLIFQQLKLKNMKKLFLMLAVLFFALSINAQEKVKQQEVGLIFSGLNSFGLTYRIGSNKSLWRFQTLFFKGSSSSDALADSLFNEKSSIMLTARVGKEFRANILEKLEFRYGGDILFGFSENKSKRNDISRFDRDNLDKNTAYSVGINLMIGLNYVFNNRLVIGAELLPSVRYTKTIRVDQNTIGDEIKREGNGITYGISNNSARLSVLFRF